MVMPDKRARQKMAAPQPEPSAHDRRLAAEAEYNAYWERNFPSRKSDTFSLDDPDIDKWTLLSVARASTIMGNRLKALRHEKLMWKDVKSSLRPEANADVIATIISRPDCPDRARKLFADHESPVVRAAVGRWCKNTNVLIKLAFDDDTDVANAVAANDAAPKRARVLAAVRW